MLNTFCEIAVGVIVAPLVGRFPERRCLCPFTPASSSGKSPDDVTLANARASARREAAAFRVWLFAIARSSYPSSSLSPKIFHHAFFGRESSGFACCHGTGDCQPGGVATSAFLYFGSAANVATLQSVTVARRNRLMICCLLLLRGPAVLPLTNRSDS